MTTEQKTLRPAAGLLVVSALLMSWALAHPAAADEPAFKRNDRVNVNENWSCNRRPLPRPFSARVLKVLKTEGFTIEEIVAARNEGREPRPQTMHKLRVRPDAGGRCRMWVWGRNALPR
ncbi:MAG: hypothetical protein AAF183_13085 [Pseudomonadota bacterium]